MAERNWSELTTPKAPKRDTIIAATVAAPKEESSSRETYTDPETGTAKELPIFVEVSMGIAEKELLALAQKYHADIYQKVEPSRERDGRWAFDMGEKRIELKTEPEGKWVYICYDDSGRVTWSEREPYIKAIEARSTSL